MMESTMFEYCLSWSWDFFDFSIPQNQGDKFNHRRFPGIPQTLNLCLQGDRYSVALLRYFEEFLVFFRNGLRATADARN